MNNYEVLGISPGASKKEVVEAYRKKAKEFHPDLNPDNPDAAKRFKEINDAYRAITSYGVTRDVTETFSATHDYPPRRVNSVKEITLTIEEAINGVLYRIDDADERCDTCSGGGEICLKYPIPCHYCKGTGVSTNKNSGLLHIDVVCSHCDGTGKSTRQKCGECHGFGVKSGAGLVIELPPGCLAGDSFIVENGYSNPSRNIIGDLEVVIAIKKDPRYRIVGSDIEMELKLEVWEAVLGASKVIV